MAITQEELREFQDFASSRLADSLGELVRLWEESRRVEASAKALRESHADAEADRVAPSAEVFAEARRAMGISE